MSSSGVPESVKNQQEEEVEVLEAVYGSDFEDLRKKDVWKVWRPAEFRILLYPSKEGVSSDAHVYVTVWMHVKFTDSYPISTPPMIDIQDEKGLSKNDVKSLKRLVEEKAASLVGQAMICDLCQYAQEYLHSKNHPPDYQSFYEGMLKNQRRREIVDEDQRRRLEEEQIERERLEMEAIEIELRKRHDQRKQEAMQRRIGKFRKDDYGPDEDGSNGDFENGLIQMDHIAISSTDRSRSTSLPPSPAVIPSNSAIAKRKGQRGISREEASSFNLYSGSRIKITVKGRDCTAVIGSKIGSSYQCHTDFFGVIEDTGQTVIITEWILKLKRNNAGKIVASTNDERADAFQREIHSLEQEFRGLVKLDHPNLLKYLSISTQDIRQTAPVDTFSIILLKEHSSNSYSVPVSHFQRRDIALPRDYLRNLMKDILSALDYLHSRAVLHKDITEDCIWDSGGGGGFLLSDYSIRKRILDLMEAYNDTLFDIRLQQDDDMNPARRMIGIGRTSKKSEVLTLGVCLLKLAIGRSAFKKVDGCGFLRIPDDDSVLPFNDPLRNLIEKMIARDEEQRWTCAKLLTHPFFTDGDTGMNGQHYGIRRRKSTSDGGGDDEENDDGDTTRLPYPLLGGSTRLETEFDILKLLGRGGFGDVMKVKNKLDDCVYAIKRVILNPKSKELNKKIIREVKLLSRLNHENVVRYYNSWIEQRAIEKPVSESKSSSDTSTTPQSVVNMKKFPTPATVLPSEEKQRASELLPKKTLRKKLSFGDDDIEAMAPPPAADASAEWSVSYAPVLEESSSSSDEDDDALGNLFFSNADRNFMDDVNEPDDQVEDLVVFENGNDAPGQRVKPADTEEKSDSANLEQQRQEPSTDVIQILYIQMEFCEKNTLRQAIDYGELVDDKKRAWRLFRELLEGLSYIHRQGMIHRDLKPVNIFLDSHDHVKIGDFGLATKLLATLTGQDAAIAALEDISQSGAGDWANLSLEIQSELTTKIGTALYVSPELCPTPGKAAACNSTSSKIAYTQKVDMYSLGIVFFEMFYRPLKTGMERIKLLTDLRRPEVILPPDFIHQPSSGKLVGILQWLLQHDADRRPTAEELLRSDLLPPVEMQPSEFQLTVNQTLLNTQTHQYKWLVNALLDNQHPTSVQEYVYDADMYDLGQFSAADALIRQWVEEKLVDLFRAYGAVRVETPLLLPKSKILTEHAEARVDVMDRSGCVLHLPYDLRIPFARFAVRSQVVHMKRYCVSTVYRDEKRSSHPRQLTECDFDVVTSPNGCNVAMAEVLALASDIVSEFQMLRGRDFVIKLNHTSILKAILIYSGVEDVSNYAQLLKLLSIDHADGGGAERLYKDKRHQRLKDEFRLTDKCIVQIISLLQLEGPLSKIQCVLRCITKRKDSPASALAKEGLHDLENIQNNAEKLGATLPIVISLNLIFNLQEYDGPIFQLVSESSKGVNDKKMSVEKSNKKFADVKTVAAGGRYDQLLNYFRKPARLTKPVSSSNAGLIFTGGTAPAQGAVGMSLAFDLLVQWIAATTPRHAKSSTAATNTNKAASAIGLSPYDILVCSVGHKMMMKEKLNLVRNLRTARLKTDFLHEPVQNLEDLQDFCTRTGIGYLVALKDAEGGFGGPGSASSRVRYWDKCQERTVEKKLALTEIVAFLQEKRVEESTNKDDSGPGTVGGGSGSQQHEGQGELLSSIGDTGTSKPNPISTSSYFSNMRVHYAVTERPPHNIRKRVEGQMGNVLAGVLQKFSPKEVIEVIATDLPGCVVKQLAAVGEFNRDEGTFRTSMNDVAGKFNKFKKELRLVVDLIGDLKFARNEDRQTRQQWGTGVVIVYSYADDCYRFLL